eukprot:1293441-Pleurochrysis_carterae.AAC.1
MPLRWRPSSARLSQMAAATAYANQGKADAGVVRHYIVRRDYYEPDLVWYEPGENLGSELLQQYEQSLAEEAAANLASAREDADIIDLEMPDVECARHRPSLE